MPERRESWEERWEAITDLLHGEAVRSQVQLVKLLKTKGFKVTQSSVSRDLTEMGVVKAEGRYLPAEALSADGAVPPGLAELGGFLLGSAPSGANLLVIRTTTGAASSVALALDRAGWPEVVGTIAGDDTIFVAVAGRPQQARVAARLERLRKETRNG